MGVSEYVPYERRWPDVIAPNPAPDSMNVSISLNQLSFTLNHPLGQTMSYVVTTSPNIGSGGGSDVGNGLRTVSISGLKASTTYYWRVEAVDSSGRDTTKNYWFTTAPVYSNSFPTQGTPVLNSTEGGNTPQEDLTAYNQTTTDQDGDKTTNVYNWLKGSGSGTSITNLVLPFDTKPNPHDIYSGTATTRDYSGYSNNGDVFGAAWTQGRVGGAFSFDGNDFIRVEEQGNSLDGGGSWSAISIEFWIRATRMGSTEKLIWKPDRYNRTTVSYEIDFRYRDNPRRLEFTWRVNTTDGLYTTSYYRTTQLTSWHHVMFTYKSGVGLRIYFDGTQVAQNLNSARTGNIVDTDGPLEIAFNSGSDFAGILDEIRLYPSQMSSAFLSQRYQDTRDGSSDKSSMPAEDIVIGDIWVVQVTPNDGQQDGQTLLSNQITVGKTDQAPSIDWYSPSNSIVSIIERQFIDFKQVSSNQDGGPLSFQWILDSVNQATTQNWTSPNLSVGTHIVQVTVSDGIHSTYQRWTVTVQTRPPNPAQYTLYIQTSGVGTTNPSDNRLYYAGDAVSVQALPESGWTLDYWLLDNKNVGSSNPYVLILDDNHVLVAVFKGNPQTFPWEILIPISTVSLVAASAILYFRKKRPDP